MDMDNDRLSAAADLCALASMAFSVPTEELARAVSSGAFQADWGDAYAAFSGEGSKAALENVGPTTFEQMRREHSRLYDLQGEGVLIWPYESCFLYRERGGEGMPGLFRTPAQMAVEESMRQAGVQPVDARTEPADSIVKEFAFTSLLLGRGEAGLDDACAFINDHLLQWAPGFMEQTLRETRLEAYRMLASSGLRLLAALSRECSSRAVVPR